MRSPALSTALLVFALSLAPARAQPPALAPAPPTQKPQQAEDMMTRETGADQLARDGKFTEAADEFAWLWQHMLEHDPAMLGVRTSFMAGSMTELAAKSPEAKQKFIALRDQTAVRLKAPEVDREAVKDFAVLNTVVGEPQRTVAWFRTVKDDPRWRPAITQLTMTDDSLETSLADGGHWAEIASLYEDPAKVIEMWHQIALEVPGPRAETKPGQDPAMQDVAAQTLHRRAGRMYAGLLAAGREEDAKKFAARAREIDDSLGMFRALMLTALKAGQVRPDQADWFEAFFEKGPDEAKLAALGREVIAELGIQYGEAMEHSEPKAPRDNK